MKRGDKWRGEESILKTQDRLYLKRGEEREEEMRGTKKMKKRGFCTIKFDIAVQ